MKKLTNLEKNLFGQTTTQEQNRVVVARAYLSEEQTQQLFQNQGCIRFVSNAVLSAVSLLNTVLTNQAIDEKRPLSKSDQFFLSRLEEIKTEIETLRNGIREKDRETLQQLENELADPTKLDTHKLDTLKENIEKRETAWKNYPVLLNQAMFNRFMGLLKEGFPFLKDADSVGLNIALYDVLASLQRFVKGKGGYPRFKAKHYYNPRIRFANAKMITRHKVKLPKMDVFKIGKTKLCGEVKHIDMVFENGKWLCHILCQQTLERKPSLKGVLGIDRGVTVHLALSDGRLIPFPPELKDKIKRLEKRIKATQRLLSRSKKGSNNRQKLKEKISRLHRDIRMIKDDWQNKLAHQIVVKEENHHIAIEDLNIQNMTKSAKGTKEKPGKNVKAKSGLNRSILAQSWHRFELKLRSKAEEVGGTLLKVKPHYTSQTCSCCGKKHANNRHKLKFQCVYCGYSDHADLNAAKNIHSRYLLKKQELFKEWGKRGLTSPHNP